MHDQPELTELNQLVARLKAAQTAVKENDKKFVARFRDGTNELLLGSDRTWQRLKDGDDWQNLKPAKWLGRVRAAVAILDGGSKLITIYKDFPFYRDGMQHIETLERSTNDRRIAVLLAPTGTGKTALARNAEDQSRTTRSYVMASPAWREGAKLCRGEGNAPAIAAGIYQALTRENVQKAGFIVALQKLTDFLNANPRTILIDQAERGGTSLMTLLIHLVDETPARFVYLAYPTHYYRIVNATTGALAETKQFLGRCIKPVFDAYANGTKFEDVRCMLRHANITGIPKKDVEEALDKILASGGMRTLGDAIAKASASADEAGAEVDGALLLDCLDEVIGIRVEKKAQELEEAA